jgi:ribosomal protein S18 acetylase RimI-like enzyme
MPPQAPTPVDLRAATAQDAAIMARLLHDTDPELAAREWRHWARPGESLLSAAERRCAAEDTDLSFHNATLATSIDAVVGLLQAIPVLSTDLKNGGRRASELANLPDSIHLLALYVVPHYRRLGVGRLLMRQMEVRAADLGFRIATLFTRADNEPALLLYQRLGYSEYGHATVALGVDPQATVQFLSLCKHIEMGIAPEQRCEE